MFSLEQESKDGRNIWIKSNICGIFLIIDHKLQSIIEQGGKVREGERMRKV